MAVMDRRPIDLSAAGSGEDGAAAASRRAKAGAREALMPGLLAHEQVDAPREAGRHRPQGPTNLSAPGSSEGAAAAASRGAKVRAQEALIPGLPADGQLDARREAGRHRRQGPTDPSAAGIRQDAATAASCGANARGRQAGRHRRRSWR